jgi:hypothetical protein
MTLRRLSPAQAGLISCLLIVIAFGAAFEGARAFGAAQAPLSGPVKVAVRRVTESQYRHIIADVFGPDIKINARFEPEKREDGLQAIGSLQLSITSGGFEQYYALGKSIADQALDPKRRDATVGCKPADATKPDDACAATFIRTYGERLFRRPLTDGELAARVATAHKGAATGDFYDGLKLSLISLLVAPEYLFRMEMAEPNPAAGGQPRLDGYTKAARLSFLLWDTGPDPELMAAARSGAIQTDAGLQAQLSRMTASPRLQDGGRAFFTDMLQFDQFDGLNKDPATYPKFSQSVADSAREETLKTLIDLLIVKKRDYRDIFTSNDTFINRPLAAVYQVPFNSKSEWTAHTFPASSERSGILTQVTFLSLFSHPGSSSPTKRGVKLHEIFMCQPTPDPPANVDFSKVQATQNGTVRSRLTDHMTNPGCSVCHRNSDPVGLTLEHFDGLGQLRTLENGAPIDVSGDIGGKKINGAQGLGQLFHDEPRVPACLVRDLYYYGVGRPVNYSESAYLDAQTKTFAAAGYKLPDLMAQLVSSPEFFQVVMPAGVQPAGQAPRVAANTPSSSTGEAR